MLQRIRDNASGPLAYVVVALITVVFGVWGIGSYFTPSSDPAVANVGGTDITRSQLQRAYNRRYQRLRRIMGDKFDPAMVPPEKLRRTVLEGLVNDALMNQYAQSAGYRVTDTRLLATIRQNERFQVDGRFSPERYRSVLSRAGLAPSQYESRLSRQIKNAELRRQINSSAFAAPAAVDAAYKLANQQRRVRYIAFDPAAYRQQVQLGANEVEQYYNEHAQAFMRGPRVKLAYVELNRQAAGRQSAASDKTLRALYQDNKAQLGSAERRSAQRIRVPINGDSGKARNTVQQLAAALDQGKPFQAVAAAAPEPVSHGRIERQTRDALAGPIGETLFALEKNQVSKPIHTDDAWVLLKLEKIVPAETPAFDDPKVQQRLRAMAATQRNTKAYQEKSDRLESLAFQAPNGLQTLADKLGLEIQHSGWVTRDGGAGIGQYDAVRQAAFSDAVYKDKLNSTPIALGADRRVVLRISDRQPAQRRPLEAVRSQIRERLMTEKAAAKARQAARQALTRLRSGAASMQSLADNSAARIKTPGYIQRSNNTIDAGVREAAFALPKPGKSQSSYSLTQTRTGSPALVAVDAVREGKAQLARDQFAGQQRNYTAGLEYAAFQAYLRDNADIEIHDNRLN